MRAAWLLFVMPMLAWAETPRLTVETGLPSGTASELEPLAWSPSLQVYLVERNDRRPNGAERSWSLYGRALELLGYATLSTEAGVSNEHVQWVSEGDAAARNELAKLATDAREKLVLKQSLTPLLSTWQKLKRTACPVRARKRDGVVEIESTRELPVAEIETPLPPEDARRGCHAAAAGAPRCFAGADKTVLALVPFKQDCGVSQTRMVLYDPAALVYLAEGREAEAAFKKGNLPAAKAHAEASLKLEPHHAPARFLLACIAARSGVSFRDGRGELEAILGGEEERQMWLPRIEKDSSLASWRSDPEYPRWRAQFPTRTPIK